MNQEWVFDTARATVAIRGRARQFGSGRKGVVSADQGREGDAKTPLGRYPVRFGFYRADRLPRPRTALTMHVTQPTDGWCDDPDHTAYNRWVTTPFAASHETMWRADGAYDVVVVIGHNDDPPVPGLGSAVFVHIRQPDHRPTLGCLALSPRDMLDWLAEVRCGDTVCVV